MINNGKTSNLTSVLLFFVPILSFLSTINLPQILILDIYLIILSQLFFLIVIFSISLILHKFFLKEYLNFNFFFLINALTIYLLFFYKNFKSFLYILHKKYYLFDDLIILIIYFCFYIFMIKFHKKLKDFLIRFLSIYIILQFVLFSYNFYNYKINPNNDQFTEKSSNHLTTFKTNLIKEDTSEEAIFFIILDGMMSLDVAEKLNIIKNKNEIIEKLESKNFRYRKNFITNYDVTYLSIASLLQGIYPVVETSDKYFNRDQFFPAFILDHGKDNSFFQILRKTNKKFNWLGNTWAYCQDNIYIKCINSKKTHKYVNKIKPFYFDSIFIYLLNFYTQDKKNNDTINIFKNFNIIFDKNEIFLIHILSPHPPYVFDEKCKIKDDINIKQNLEIEYYKYAYNCLIEEIVNFSNKINSINKDNMVFVLGDHGWSFSKEIMQKHKLDPEGSRFKTFFAYKIPNRCNGIDPPNSIVNTIRFALICAGNNDLMYLEDLKFKTFYENDNNYGKVFLKK